MIKPDQIPDEVVAVYVDAYCGKDLTRKAAIAAAREEYRKKIAEQAAENEKLRAVLELYREAVRIDATMEGPKFMGSNASALKRAWEADLAALGGKDD